MADLVALLDAFDRMVVSAAEVDSEAAGQAASAGARARRRRGYLGETVVVALAGGTGSGKSSLINALAAEEVAMTGPQRPTTSRPLAWIPANPEPGLTRLLDDMDVSERVGHDDHDWLAVIDLPDMDSVAEEHRATVERLLPEVDAIVWVVDPEKYQDRLLHEEYLKPLAAHASRFRFVLNQIDRVERTHLPALVADLAESLAGDGIADPVITVTAADPAIGPTVGIDELLAGLRGLGDAKAVIHDRVVVEISEAAARLAASLGVDDGGGTGFASDWERARCDAAAQVTVDLVGRRATAEVERLGRTIGRRHLGLIRPPVVPEEIPLSIPGDSGPGRRAAVEALDAQLVRLAELVDGSVRSLVRQVRAGLDAAVSESSTTVAVASGVRPGPAPRWWAVARLVRWLGVLAMVVGAVMVLDTYRAGGSFLAPVSVVLSGVAALVVPRILAGASGGRWAARGLDALTSDTEDHVARELDRRIGRPLREALRLRAGVASSYLELRLVADSDLGSRR